MRLEALGDRISLEVLDLADVRKTSDTIKRGLVLGLASGISSLTVGSVNPELSQTLLTVTALTEAILGTDFVLVGMEISKRREKIEELIRDQLKNLAKRSAHFVNRLEDYDRELLSEIMRTALYLYLDGRAVGRDKDIVSDIFSDFR